MASGNASAAGYTAAGGALNSGLTFAYDYGNPSSPSTNNVQNSGQGPTMAAAQQLPAASPYGNLSAYLPAGQSSGTGSIGMPNQ